MSCAFVMSCATQSWWIVRLLLALPAVMVVASSTLSAGESAPRWRWANPAPHGANVQDVASGLGLTVQVAERGQIFTSEDLRFWEPRESNTTRSLRAVTFFNDRIVITGERGLILYGDEPDRFEQVQLDTDNWLEGLAATENIMVAVGDNGAIYTSEDGANWTQRESPTTKWFRDVAFYKDAFYAVGKNGVIAKSPDGTVWELQESGTETHLNGIAGAENRLWAVGENGLVLTSTTAGTVWTQVDIGATNSLHAIESHLGGAAIAGDGELYYRSFTPDWINAHSADSASTLPRWNYSTANWLDTFHFIAGKSGMMVEGFQTNSSSPLVWVTRYDSIRNWLWDLHRTPEFYVTVGYNGTVMTSVDGFEWTLELVPSTAQETIFLGVGGTTNMLLAVGENGRIITSTNAFTKTVTVTPEGESITNQVSTLGIFWEAQLNATTSDLQGIASFSNQFIVCGAEGRIMTSPNGKTWTHQLTPTSAYLSGLEASTNVVVASGKTGTILTSQDGIEWTARPSGRTDWIYRVRYLAGRWFAVGQNGTVLTSESTLSWQSHETGTTRWLTDISYVNGTFYVIGTQGTVLQSKDGLSWENIGTVTGKSMFGIAHHEGQLMIAGAEGAIIRAELQPSNAPINFQSFARRDDRSILLLHGVPGQRFTLEDSGDLIHWDQGQTFEFLDNTGTLLLLGGETPAEEERFYRTSLPTETNSP